MSQRSKTRAPRGGASGSPPSKPPTAVAAPAPEPTNGAGQHSLISALQGLLPERLSEDVLSGTVHIRLAGQVFNLPVPPIRANRTWKALCNERLVAVLGDIEAPDATAATVMAFLSGMTDTQIELLYAYDTSGVLPKQEWLEDNVTEAELLTALLGVMAAAFPFVAAVIDLVRDGGAAVQQTVLEMWSRRTSGSPPTTDGPPATLKAN